MRPNPLQLLFVLFIATVLGCSGDHETETSSQHETESEHPTTEFSVDSEGTAVRSCSPVDLSAVDMLLGTNDERTVIVQLYTSLAEAEEQWELGGGYAVGGLWIGLCNSERTHCEKAEDGELLVESVTGDQIKGKLSFTLDQIILKSHPFVLKVAATERPRCGV